MERRRFLKTAGLGSAMLATPLSAPFKASEVSATPTQTKRRPKIAFLGTVVRRHSHAQHFLDRHTLGYTWKGGWQKPRIDVASVFVDQFPEEDLAKSRTERHGLKLYPTIEEALTLGGSKLAVDGVVLIGEHGDYPTNEKGQHLYPRYGWFKKVVKVFEDSGRSVPVFNDKHLSTDWDECVEMIEDSRRLEFAFLAGSSLPVTRRMPAIDMPLGTPLQESVCVAYGGIDSYDIHALETAQCMSERRQGGETGVKQIHALRDENLWKRLDAEDCKTTRKLIVSALTRSHNLPVKDGFPTAPVSM
ncbi:MAG: twin-arginine translocation signal domain-containing protein, partial [Rubripirellula sp.]